MGLGAKFPWHVDEFVNGAFRSELAQENRSVYLLSTGEDNQMFKRLIEAYNKGELAAEASDIFARYYG